MEHRLGNRVTICIAVHLCCASGRQGRGEIVNISASGAFIRTEMSYPLLTAILIRLDGLPCSSKPRAYRAYVARIDAAGIAVEWPEFNPRIMDRLVSGASPGARTPRTEPPRRHASVEVGLGHDARRGDRDCATHATA